MKTSRIRQPTGWLEGKLSGRAGNEALRGQKGRISFNVSTSQRPYCLWYFLHWFSLSARGLGSQCARMSDSSVKAARDNSDRLMMFGRMQDSRSTPRFQCLCLSCLANFGVLEFTESAPHHSIESGYTSGIIVYSTFVGAGVIRPAAGENQ